MASSKRMTSDEVRVVLSRIPERTYLAGLTVSVRGMFSMPQHAMITLLYASGATPRDWGEDVAVASRSEYDAMMRVASHRPDGLLVLREADVLRLVVLPCPEDVQPTPAVLRGLLDL